MNTYSPSHTNEDIPLHTTDALPVDDAEVEAVLRDITAEVKKIHISNAVV